MFDKNNNGFRRVVESDNQVVTEYRNDIYNFTYVDNFSGPSEPKIELKSHNTGDILKQLIADLSYTNNRLNLVMTLIDQFCYEGVIPEEVIHALESALNTEDVRHKRQK